MRYLYAFACCLLVAAIVADVCGKRYYSKAMQTTARATAHPADRDVARATAHRDIAIGNVFTDAGFHFAVLAVIFWLASMADDRRFTLIPLALLALYVGLFLIAV